MRRRTVLFRCGWCVGAAICAITALALTGGPESAPQRGAGAAPRLPAYASGLFAPTPELDPDAVKHLAAAASPPRELPAIPGEYRAPVSPAPIGLAMVVPAGGIAPALPLAPVVPAGASMPLAPVAGASAVTGAPTVPTVPVPTMAAFPNAPMPISPAAYPPAAPVAPASAAPLAPVAPITASIAAPAPVAPRGPIHPSQPAMFPLPQMALPTPADAMPPPVEPTPDLGTMVIPTLPLSNSGPGADGTPLNDYWRNGLRFESADHDFSIFVGGRFQFDVVNYLATTAMRNNIPGNVPLEDGVSFRRVRLDMGGTLYKNMEYYAQVDFFNGYATDIAENRLSNVPAITDMWLTFKDLPLIGNIRVGNQKPLYSFEHLTSSRFLPFLERSLGFDAFVENFNNGFAPGITLFNSYGDRRGTIGVGLFKNARTPFAWNVGRNEAEVNGRITYLPVDSEGGKYLVHFGVGGAIRDLDDDQTRLRSRLDARNSPSQFAPLIADTGLIFGNRQQLLIPELAIVAGPWTFQSEYYASWVQNAATVGPNGQRLTPQGTVYMQSAYGELSLFLTGEHREYDRNAGVFTRVVPKRPLAWSRCGFTGCGAWQTALRYSYLDLNDKGINGGRVHDMTVGLNWFMNPNMKVQWNYFLAHRNVADPAGDGFIQGFATRLAIDF